MGFITVAGQNQIAAKSISKDLNIVSFVLANIAGLGEEPADRIEAMPDAGDIMDTLPVTKAGYVNSNQVVYSLVMDSTIGDYDFNWIGLVDDEGVLIAVTYTPLIPKIKTVGAVPGNNITRNFLIAYSGIQATTAIAVPAETWQIDFTARLLGIDERERLSNFDIYEHEFFEGNGFVVTENAGNYDIDVGVGYVGGIRCQLNAIQTINAPALPTSIWLDASLQGDINGVSEVINLSASNVVIADSVDELGFNHYVTKIADIDAGGVVTDTRNITTVHENKADPHSQYLTQAEVDVLPSITGSVADNNLTVGLKAGTLSFRSSDLTSGIFNLRAFSGLSLVIPSGATLGTVDAVKSRLILLAIDNAGTIKHAVVNEAGGVNLNEEGLISTVAIDATADLDNVIYSDAVYTGVPYRVVGVLESTQPIAGTWDTARTLLQGAGGNALSAMSSLGYGQTWQSVTRALGTTYYNTTGKPIVVNAIFDQSVSGTSNFIVDGFTLGWATTTVGLGAQIWGQSFEVPAGASYSISAGAGLILWAELR